MNLALETQAQPQDAVTTMALEGEISLGDMAEVNEMLFRLARRGARLLVLDFSDVSHFDYRGVKGLIARAELFRRVGGDVKLCGMSPYVHAIFRSAGAHDAFDYYGTADDARTAFGPSDGPG